MNPRDWLAEVDEEILCADGFDEAIIGYIERFGEEPVALYDRDHVIAIMVDRDGMTYDEALEFFDYNIIGFGGERVPAFATLFWKDEEE